MSHEDESVRSEVETVDQGQEQDQSQGKEYEMVDDADADGITDRTLPANGDDDHMMTDGSSTMAVIVTGLAARHGNT